MTRPAAGPACPSPPPCPYTHTRALLLLLPCCTQPALAVSHAQGVANRDLKLENLLLDRPTSGADGDWPLLRICDFGEACSKGRRWSLPHMGACAARRALLRERRSTPLNAPSAPAGYSKHELNSTAKTGARLAGGGSRCRARCPASTAARPRAQASPARLPLAPPLALQAWARRCTWRPR